MAEPASTNQPKEADQPVYKGYPVSYAIGRFMSEMFARICFGIRAQNIERVPTQGPALIIANHQSYLDPPFLGCLIPGRHLDFVARASLFDIPLAGRYIARLNTIPIKAGGEAGAMKETLRRLGAGRACVMFPEGTRTDDGAMQPFQRGVAVLVKRANCPVVPAAIEGAYDAWPRTSKFPKVFTSKVEVAYGHPIPHNELMANGVDAALDRLASEVEALRLGLRDRLRERTNGKFPKPGPGDRSSVAD